MLWPNTFSKVGTVLLFGGEVHERPTSKNGFGAADSGPIAGQIRAGLLGGHAALSFAVPGARFGCCAETT